MRCRCCRDTSAVEEPPPDDLDIGLGIQQEMSATTQQIPEEVIDDDDEEQEGAVGGILDAKHNPSILQEDMDLQGIIAVMPLSPSTEASEGIGGDEKPLVKVNDK